MGRTAWHCGALGVVFLAIHTTAARADTVVLPTFDVVATTPLNGGQINVSQSPFAVWQSTSQDMQTFNDTTLTDTLARSAPGVTTGNVSGNEFEPDLFYRGFDATAVTGTPQGLAVYQNGTRINEAYGDVVNWDLIAPNAIDKTTIIAANPIFGLNALGGAVVVTMKNGFTWQGFEADGQGGSFYNAQEQLQYGKQVGDWAVYLAASQINDGGWRVAEASQLTNFYGDLGYKANGFESHLELTAGNTQFGVAAYTPIQLLQMNYGSVYTIPQTTYNQMAMLQWNGSYAYSPTLNFQAAAYFRGFNQQHQDGNPTSVTPCPPLSCLNGAPVHDVQGGIIPDISQNGALDLGENDRNQTQSRSLGVSGQAVDTDKIYGHDNTLTVGTSLDYGWTHYTGNSQLGTISFTNFSYPVTGYPYIIDEPDSYLNPIDVDANNTYVGVYALDTFNATDRLTLTGGARFNFAGISLAGTNDALLSGYSDYFHLNPTVGFTYKITPDVNFYAGYAMTNRTPTPFELGCASATYPCIVDNFLSVDPPLKQVVGNTFELGLRGQNALAPLGSQWGKLSWSAGLFRTTSTNDILPVTSQFTGFGYYTNVGTTLRQGAEASAQWTGNRWTAYANYTYIDAVYLSTFEEPSPFNPLADANGNILISNGTPIAGIPKNTLKAGFDYAVTDQWKVGMDMIAASGQVIFGNENGALPQIPGYTTFGAHVSYQYNKQVELFGYAQNIFDQRYYTSGGLTQPEQFMAGPLLTDPRTYGPAKPFAIYAGLRVKL
jgi:iron complex outermembrane recepter protein